MGETGLIMPPPLPPTSERLERHGLFLIEDGQTIFLWIGRDAVPQLVMDVFDLPSYDQLRGGKVNKFPYLLPYFLNQRGNTKLTYKTLGITQTMNRLHYRSSTTPSRSV